MKWYSSVDPESHQVIVGGRTVISTIVAVLIIAFADDIKNLVIDAETSNVIEANTRQDIGIIAKSVTEHGQMILSHNERILRLEFSERDHQELQLQISSNTTLIQKIQDMQIRVFERMNVLSSRDRAFESRIKSLERK